MATRKRRYNLRRIRATWIYSVDEIAELFAVHEKTVLRWIRKGLTPNPGRPYLVRGDELRRFLGAEQSSKRRKCAETEFLCLKCREPREAYLGIADIVVLSPTLLRLKALCAICGGNVSVTRAVRTLPKLRTLFEIQELTGAHLLERAEPSLNVHLEP